MAEEKYRSASFARINLFLMGFIALVLAVGSMKLTASVVLPLIIAILLAFVLEPVIILLEKIKIPRAIGAVVVVLILAAGLYIVVLVLFQSVKTIMTLYPKYEERFSYLYSLIAKTFRLPYDEQISLFQNLWGQLGVRAQVQSFALATSESLLGFLTDTVMVVLFVVFLLLEIGHFRKRIETAFAGIMSTRIQKIVTDVIKQVARYLSVKFFISLATGVLVGVILAWIGMDFPIIWGVISFILNFIPNIGSIAAGAGVTVFALVQFWPNPSPIIGAFLTVLGVNMVLGNVVEPRVQGQNLGLSPFIILVSLSGWGWLWGFSGLVLAVPMTVIVKIVCENVPGLESASIMMSSYSVVKQKRHK
ncbi:MAG: AI-2E family transporter [Spirochaetes bacterium GWB1_59_5]|nr:MAG: AI-2E family transporter [Spirochaetes bacterium GWB1_59_5]